MGFGALLLAGVRFLGSINGLAPATSCFQQFTLRFIIRCYGAAPWHYSRFLIYPIKRMCLQRVGGRYWFIRDLLRDHFAVKELKQVKSG
jgi:hypothetical protein